MRRLCARCWRVLAVARPALRRHRPGRGRWRATCFARTRSAPTRTRPASTAASTSPGIGWRVRPRARVGGRVVRRRRPGLRSYRDDPARRLRRLAHPSRRDRRRKGATVAEGDAVGIAGAQRRRRVAGAVRPSRDPGLVRGRRLRRPGDAPAAACGRSTSAGAHRRRSRRAPPRHLRRRPAPVAAPAPRRSSPAVPSRRRGRQRASAHGPQPTPRLGRAAAAPAPRCARDRRSGPRPAVRPPRRPGPAVTPCRAATPPSSAGTGRRSPTIARHAARTRAERRRLHAAAVASTPPTPACGRRSRGALAAADRRPTRTRARRRKLACRAAASASSLGALAGSQRRCRRDDAIGVEPWRRRRPGAARQRDRATTSDRARRFGAWRRRRRASGSPRPGARTPADRRLLLVGRPAARRRHRSAQAGAAGAASVESIGDGALLPDDADLLRELDAAHRARVHDDRGGHPRAQSAPAWRRHVLPDRRRRARVEGGAGRGGAGPVAAGVRRPDRGRLA